MHVERMHAPWVAIALTFVASTGNNIGKALQVIRFLRLQLWLYTFVEV